MVVLTLSDEDMEYILALLDKEKNKIELLQKQGTILQETCDRLVKRNSGVQAIFQARMVPYICVLTDKDTGEINHLTFKQFEEFYGAFPRLFNESQIMSYIADWALEHGYTIMFKRINDLKVVK
jgi:hypothetical protein